MALQEPFGIFVDIFRTCVAIEWDLFLHLRLRPMAVLEDEQGVRRSDPHQRREKVLHLTISQKWPMHVQLVGIKRVPNFRSGSS